MDCRDRIDWSLLAWAVAALLVTGACLAPLLGWWVLLWAIGH